MKTTLLIKKKKVTDLDLIGNILCLDFINTVAWRGSNPPIEYLNSYNDLTNWSHYVGILSDTEARRLFDNVIKFPVKTSNVLKNAIKLREVLYRIFSFIIDGKPPKKKDLDFFNQNLSKAVVNSQIVQKIGGFCLNFSRDKDNLEWILHPIIRSACNLLISNELKKIRKCADPKCGWLFLDKTRNHTRIWCDMKGCGNRAKVNRFRKKRRNKTIVDNQSSEEISSNG